MMKLPSPADVRAEFDRRFAVDPESATNYLYQLGADCGYIKQEAIARNVCWESPSPWGSLEITINCSKPEKDPRAIAAAVQEGTPLEESTGEPQCDLCWENEMWPGSPGHPAKPGLRIAAIMLGGERWGLQFSPYGYFPEHCIALAAQHRPMVIDGAAIGRLLDFVDLFPFYFIGSNADLPIVGGSILSHDHFQGGRHQFPLMSAPLRQRIKMRPFLTVEAGIVEWPASTLRLESPDRHALQQAAEHILETWHNFSFPQAGVVAFDEGAHHNTLNPIVTKDARTGVYTLHLVLRNNRTDAAHPWGIFHPTANLHHIKKENIGLIEIMGRAILPGRLAKELPAVQETLLDAAASGAAPEELQAQLEANTLTTAHAPWATAIYQRRFTPGFRRAEILSLPKAPTTTGPSAEPTILLPWMQDEVGTVFAQVLACTGVFKNDDAGRAGWAAFLAAIDAQPIPGKDAQ